MGANEIKKIADKIKRENASIERKEKTYKGEWYTVNSIFGNDWAIFFALLGGREAGKSYSVMKHAVRNKVKKQDKFKFYWMRLTDAATDNLLVGGADKLVDPDIKRKYNLNLTTRGNTVYMYDPVFIEDNIGLKKESKTNKRTFCEVLSCSTFYNTKGVGYFDNEYDGEYFIVLDEMNRENSERNSFDIVYNFTNLIENVARSTKNKIKVVMIGNTLEEASDILTAFNFIPDDFGRYKLKSKRCVIDYIKPNEEYLARRKGTVADILNGEASTFTNEIKLDRSLLVNKRLRHTPAHIIKFTKTKDTWFTLWNNNIISDYNGEQKHVIAMRRYLDERFDEELLKVVIDTFDSRAYKFTNLSTFKKFQKNMKLIKPQTR